MSEEHEQKKSKARSHGWLSKFRAKTWDGKRKSKKEVSKKACPWPLQRRSLMHLARVSIIVEESETRGEAIKGLIQNGFVRSEGEAMFLIRVLERQKEEEEYR